MPAIIKRPTITYGRLLLIELFEVNDKDLANLYNEVY